MITRRNQGPITTGVLYPLGGALLALCVSCGDSAGDAPGTAGSGGAAVAGSSASSAGSPATGGAASATGGSGSSSAGTSTSSGGTVSSGGASSGGQPSGGAGTSSGGAASGGGAGMPAGGGAGGGAPSAGSTIVPDASWACGKADGIVDPTRGELAFRMTLEVGTVRDMGATQYGKRRATDVTGGTITGSKLDATFLSAGFDYELTLSDGSIELEQVGMLKAKDGALIYMRTCGVAAPGDSLVRVVPSFEAANSSSVAWLNTGNFVATRSLDAAGKKLELVVYDVSKVTGDAPKVKLTNPTDAPNQPWECAKPSGSKGAEVFTENVSLGGSQSVGASKNGTRNVIPITGGTVTGKLAGMVVAAGADYQLVGGTTTLDARYMLASNDGEFVIVRNCGPFGALIPQFEAKASGKYAFLNTGKFISSDPGGGGGGVKITFYEAN